jgi:hypothetical protein
MRLREERNPDFLFALVRCLAGRLAIIGEFISNCGTNRATI